MKKWIARNGKTVYNTGAFYVPPSIVDLKSIEDKSGDIRFVINGKTFHFRRAKETRNRVSGMGEVRNYFRKVSTFLCEYDSHKKLIRIKLKSNRASRGIQRLKAPGVGKRMRKDEQYFIKKMRLKSYEYKYMGNIRGSGHDIEILGTKAKKIGRYIEIKGIRNKVHTINLTNREYEFAERHKKNYFLYLIEYRGKRKTMYKIPFGVLKHPTDAHTIRFRKREMDSFEVM